MESVLLRVPVARALHRYVIPGSFLIAGFFGFLTLAGVVTSGWPDPCFSMGLFCGVALPFVVLGMASGSVVGWSAVRANMIQRIELEPHRITIRGPLDNVLWTGSLHAIDDIWASSDMVSAVLGLKTPGLLALRVAEKDTAIWLRDVLRAWQARYGRMADAEADAEMDRLARTMGAATVSSREPG